MSQTIPQTTVESWGRMFHYSHHITPIYWPSENPFEDSSPCSYLPFGQGRSYGDSCLNADNNLITTEKLNRFMAFDKRTGVLQCEAGITLNEILKLVVPHGWFLPVTPGTQFVSLGGAIANDVHGKNHHRSGTFGGHVRQLGLLRSNGDRIICSPTENGPYYCATIGGLGLTGLIVWAEIQLKKIESAFINHQTLSFQNWREWLTLSQQSDKDFEYTVSWIDTLAKGRDLGRGIFFRGNHSTNGSASELQAHKYKRGIAIPCNAPSFLLNPLSISLFNKLYFLRQRKRGHSRTHYEPFFYPLDSLHHWNRLYGKPGFLQYQFVIPEENSDALADILRFISESNQPSFLAVLKMFGSQVSPGILSFPKPGITLALDFRNTGQPLMELLNNLDQIVLKNGGRVYPAKDSRMSAETFEKSFPHWRDFLQFKDPKMSSSFWRRVTA